jgi:hypothetical protein
MLYQVRAAENFSVASLGNDGYLPKICKRPEDTLKTKITTRVFWFFFSSYTPVLSQTIVLLNLHMKKWKRCLKHV